VTLDLLLIGVIIALDPLPLVPYMAILSSKRGATKGAAFVFGWLVSLAVVLVITLSATGGKPPRSGTAPSLASAAVKLLIGVGLVAAGLRQRRRMKTPREKPPARWLRRVDDMSLLFAAGLAPALQPWGMVAAGAATVVNGKFPSTASYITLFAFCLLSSSTYLSAEIYCLVRPSESVEVLGRVKKWIEGHTDQVLVIVFLALGLWLIARSLFYIVSS
jgi:Sap, sulfolipid-1-addressing protein